MVGNVGEDTFGQDYLKGLQKEGIANSRVRVVKAAKTGVSNIIVDESTGENRILFTANANNAYSDKPDGSWNLVPETAAVAVFQLEIPMRIVLHNMHVAREAGKHVIFNPAPAELIPDFAYQDIDTLIMNETESQILSAPTSTSAKVQDPILLAKQFLRRGVKDAVIVTLGGKGLAFAASSGEEGTIEAEAVEVVDTTAAGDTFVGAYAVRRAQHTGEAFDYRAALKFASVAASKSVGKQGAMAAIPYLRELQ